MIGVIRRADCCCGGGTSDREFLRNSAWKRAFSVLRPALLRPLSSNIQGSNHTETAHMHTPMTTAFRWIKRRPALVAMLATTLALAGCLGGAGGASTGNTGTNGSTGTTGGTGTNGTTAANPATPFGTFLALHLEVGNSNEQQGETFYNGGSTTSNVFQSAMWPTLVDMVALADQYGAQLTILAHVQWYEYIAKDAGRLSIVANWTASGHELGLHHHGYDHPDWDGFTERTSSRVRNDSRYRGDMGDLLAAIAGHGFMTTATPSDRSNDLPELDHVFIYDAAGRGGSVPEALRPPYRVLQSSVDVIQTGMAYHSYHDTASHLTEMKDLFDQAGDTDLIGFVTHAWDVFKQARDTGGSVADSDFKEWLDYVQSRGHSVRTVRDLLESYTQSHAIDVATSSQLLGKW